MKEALARQRKDQPAALSPAMAAAEKRLVSDSQLKIVFLAPDSARQAIKDQIAASQKSGGPAAVMILGMVKPFESIQNVSVHARLASDVVLTIAVELGSAQDAAQLAMLIPILKGFIPQSQPSGVPDLSQALSFTNSGAVVSLSLKLTEQDLVAAEQPPHVPELVTLSDSMEGAAPRARTASPSPTPAVEAASPPVAAATPTTVVTDAPPASPTPAPAAVVAVPLPPALSRAEGSGPADDPGWRDAKKKLKTGGVIKDKNGKWRAMVNSDLVEVGAIVSVRHEQAIYRWKVEAISKEEVTFNPLGRSSDK